MHTMELIGEHEGTEEWHCPQCGRRVLMSWPPNYRKIVIEIGDETIIHGGGRGGVKMQGATILSQEEPESKNDDPHLSVWSDWIGQMRLDDW